MCNSADKHRGQLALGFNVHCHAKNPYFVDNTFYLVIWSFFSYLDTISVWCIQTRIRTLEEKKSSQIRILIYYIGFCDSWEKNADNTAMMTLLELHNASKSQMLYLLGIKAWSR